MRLRLRGHPTCVEADARIAEHGRVGASANLMLAFILLLLAANIYFKAFVRHGGGDYGNIVIAIMLLLNHLAFQFTKRRRLSVIMKTIAWMWVAFVWIYLLILITSGIQEV